MTVKEIIKKYLEENGYDGLCCEDCCCFLEDLVPCSGHGDFECCTPGHKKMTSNGLLWDITEEKEIKR